MIKADQFHPSQIEIKINKAQIEHQMLLKDEQLAKQMIQDSIKNMDGSNEHKVAINKMEKKYTELLLSAENKRKEIKRLMAKLKESAGMFESDENLEDSLIEAGTTVSIEGYRQVMEVRRKELVRSIGVEKIIETSEETLAMIKELSTKTKKREKYANDLLKLVNMTPEQRLIKARKDRAKLAKKAFGGVGVIASVGSFFFPPLAIVTVPLLLTGAIGYGASKTKYGKKVIAQTKEDTKLLKQSIEKFAYPEQAQIANNTQFNQGMGNQQYQDDIYGDMR